MSTGLLSKKAESVAPATRGTAARAGLRIGEPNDSFEQEADRAANEILTGGKPQWSFSKMNVGTPLQRKCDCGGSSECAECKDQKDKKEGTLQRRATRSATPAVVPPIVHEVLNSPGKPLDSETRAFFEPRFGHDFSRVRVHQGSRESQSARSVNALAYTVGRDIVFGPGSLQPESAGGRGLLAHELAHTIQQSQSDVFDGGGLRLQRAPADASAIPKMTCVTDPSPSASAEASLTGVKLSGLSPAQKKQVAEFYKGWVAAGSTDFIAVEGYASPDSAKDSAAQQKANWGYSCNRAELVQAEFVKLGVPRSRVITFAHGETDQFSTSPKDADANRRVNISKVKVAGPAAPGTQSTGQVPGGFQVSGKSDQIAVKQTAPKDIPAGTPAKPAEQPKTEATGPTERVFSVTLEFDLKNDWRSPKPPSAPGPSAPFLCDHGVFQLGVKWNKGISVFKDRLEFLNEPELDVNVGDPSCRQNASVTAQINLMKFTILKDLIESDLVGVFGLPDGWATGLKNFPFGAGAQIKLQATPFARISPDFKGVKVGFTGGLGFEQGVEVPDAGEEKRTRVFTVGGFIGLDYDFGPAK